MRRTAAEPLQANGVALIAWGATCTVRLAAPWAGDAGDDVFLVVGEPGARFFAPAILTQARANVAAFALEDNWKPFDIRTSPRHRVSMKAQVRSVLGTSRQRGTITDISLGGLGVIVEAKPAGREVIVVTDFGGYSASLQCEMVNTRPLDGGLLLNLKFAGLSAVQQAFVRNVVTSIEAAMLARERRAS